MAPLSLEFGVAGGVAPGQRVSGDLEVVHYYDRGGGVLIAAIDGIGHGEEAAATARLAADTILRQPEEKLAAVLGRCHVALRGTRGVVLSIASIDLRQATLSWLGIGNVSGIVFRGGAHQSHPREELLVRPGVLGYGDLPALQPSAIPMRPRDLLIFATDGISRRFSEGLSSGASAQPLADYIIAHHSQRNDDALVVVARVS
jgi:serine phosphatase RsbU (regulator of sigma subunit)